MIFPVFDSGQIGKSMHRRLAIHVAYINKNRKLVIFNKFVLLEMLKNTSA